MTQQRAPVNPVAPVAIAATTTTPLLTTPLLLGIDTGGTYTDAALVDVAQHRVLAHAKALTTKGDLAVGVGLALEAVLHAAVAQGAAQQHTQLAARIALMGVSTTLATNAVVEGHGSAVALWLPGFDAHMVARTGLTQIAGCHLFAVAGGHNYHGVAHAPLDFASIENQWHQVQGKVQAFAVAASFAVRNPEHEWALRDWLQQRSDQPITLSSDLSPDLDAPRRAMTAVLNARLLSRIRALQHAVERAAARLGLRCPLMLVRGDGALDAVEQVARYPIQTVLSGPAASVVGAAWLSGLENLVVSDMGGTTTDIAVMQQGRVRLSDEGGRVGGWRTMVRAIDVATTALGGDSAVHLGSRNQVVLGPQRAVPLALLATRFPGIVEQMQQDLATSQVDSLQGQFVCLPFGLEHSDDSEHTAAATSRLAANQDLTPEMRAVLDRVGRLVWPLRQLADSPRQRRWVQRLVQLGHLQLSQVTPSDAAHVLGLQANWNGAAAQLGLQLVYRNNTLQMASAADMVALAERIWQQTVSDSGYAVLEALLPSPLFHAPLARAIAQGHSQRPYVQAALTPRLPLVAVGAPVEVYYPEVAKRLSAELVHLPHAAVANAVGAAVAPARVRVQMLVLGDGGKIFQLRSTFFTAEYDAPALALQAAHSRARERAQQQLQTLGCIEHDIQIRVSKKHLPMAQHPDDDRFLLEAVVVAEGLGRFLPSGLSLRQGAA